VMRDRTSRVVVPRAWQALPFGLAALVGLAAAALPGPRMDWGLFAIAAALTLVIGVVAWSLRRLPSAALLVGLLPLAYFVVVALLRHASHEGTSGFNPLAMLPVVWLALFGTRRQLVIGLAALAATFVVPYLVFGSPRYPHSSLRSGLLWITVGMLAGLTIESLVARTRASRDRLENILGAATATAIIGADLRGVITTYNVGAERMLGWKASEVIGRETPAIWHHPQEIADQAAQLGIEPGFEVFVQAAREGRVEMRRWRWLRKDGSELDVALTVTPERDANGELTGFLGVATDITEQVRATEQLIATGARLQGILDHTPATVSMRDREGRYVLVNHRWEEVYGRTGAEAVGRTAVELFGDAVGDDGPRRAVLDSGEVAHHQRVLSASDGSRSATTTGRSTPRALWPPTSPSASMRSRRRWRRRVRSRSSSRT
jgi:PAS domain S-box-containing protein